MIDVDYPIENGDTACAIVYRITDKDGSLWRSSPVIVQDAMRSDGIQSGVAVNAAGQYIRIPTLRHLLEGTTAQIEIYFGTVDLQLFRVIDNDPTVAYVDINPPELYVQGGIMPSLDTAIERAGVGETLYTIGGALANDPPPACSAVAIWNNRAIAVFGNEIWPSQEFLTGSGIQWPDVLKLRWDEGTGDITGVCKVNADYCAVFKQDAVGIISGQGPDGRGSGNYIVRTLSTKCGLTNPLSLASGNDGCYFQDSQSTQLMCIMANLSVERCAKGWFNDSGTLVTAALHVEALREVWFAMNDGQIVVIDYGHRTESSPFGHVYTWDVSAFGETIKGMDIVSGSPVVLFDDGSLATYTEAESQDTDDDDSPLPVLMKLRTGAMAPFGVGGYGDISEIQLIGDMLSTHIMKLTTFPNGATSGTTRQLLISSGDEGVGTRPPNCQRINHVEVEIEETLNTVAPIIRGKGLEFIGFAMLVQSRSRTRILDTGRMI